MNLGTCTVRLCGLCRLHYLGDSPKQAPASLLLNTANTRYQSRNSEQTAAAVMLTPKSPAQSVEMGMITNGSLPMFASEGGQDYFKLIIELAPQSMFETV